MNIEAVLQEGALQGVRDEVFQLLNGHSSLDEFVRWAQRNERNLPMRVRSYLHEFASGSTSVDHLYGELCEWYIATCENGESEHNRNVLPGFAFSFS